MDCIVSTWFEGTDTLFIIAAGAAVAPFLTLGLFGRRVIVVTCVCPSVRLSVCLSVRLSVCLFPSSLLTQ